MHIEITKSVAQNEVGQENTLFDTMLNTYMAEAEYD